MSPECHTQSLTPPTYPIQPQNARASASQQRPQPSTSSVSREFPRLLQKSSAELAELLTDKEAFARFLHSTEGALEARAFTRELRLEIEGMCRANIEKAEEARDLRSQMSVIRSCDAQPVKDEYEAARKKADAVTGKFNLDEALARLKTRARETDQETEKLGEDLVAGKIQPREFIDKYVPMRRLYHMDTVRAEIVEPALASRRPNGGPPQPPPPPPGAPPPASRYGGM